MGKRMSDTEEFQLQCHFKNQPASLERILRIIRVRGFTLDSLNMHIEDNDCHCVMQLSGVRSLTNLICQLASLEPVMSVTQLHCGTGVKTLATALN